MVRADTGVCPYAWLPSFREGYGEASSARDGVGVRLPRLFKAPSLWATGVFRAATDVAAAPQRGANPSFATEGREGVGFLHNKRSGTPLGMLLLGCTIEMVPYESSMTLAIFFSSFSTFGRTTVRMPFSTLAEILSRSTSSGSV